MKNEKMRFGVLAFMVAVFGLLMLFFAGCENSWMVYLLDERKKPDKREIPVDVVPVTGVTLNKTSTGILVGKTETLTATVAPSNATNKNVSWSSSDDAIATVEDGVVTAVGEGTATVTVTTEDGGFTASCTVMISATDIPVTGVTLNESTLDLTVGGGTASLTAIFTPLNATNQNVTWSTNAPGVATVLNGTVTAVGPGPATITVTTEDGGFTASCEVTVTQPVTGVTLNKTTTGILVGNTETLTATVAPSNATNQNVTWSSSDDAIATVADGVVTAVGEGTVTVTVTTEDGNFTADCTVMVSAIPVPVTDVTLNKTTTGIIEGETETLIATVLPTGATNQNVTWESSDTDVVTVDGGVVTAVNEGTATVTVTTEDGGFTAKCEIAVILKIDYEDFGIEAMTKLFNSFNVSNLDEWNDAKNIISDGGNGKNYIINVIGNFDVPGATIATFTGTNIKVSLRSDKTITLSGTGNLIRIGANQTVILRGLTLQGSSSNDTNLVQMSADGTFVMHNGKISGNASKNAYGGGVAVSGGTFTMNGGEISDNTANLGSSGGGVYVGISGTFTMNGGKISDNTASYNGGGVIVTGATFTMNGGEISDNTGGGTGTTNGGGGVYVANNGNFTMQGGKISKNNHTANGGGVFMTGANAKFTMENGEISGNTAPNGGGVYTDGGTFTMQDGEISGNTATVNGTNGGGGGVYVNTSGTFTMYGGTITDNTGTGTSTGGGVRNSGTFTMNSGTISSNKGNNGGGGVTVANNGTFTMHGGEITGNTAIANGTTGGGVLVANTGTFIMQVGTISGNTATNGGGVGLGNNGTFTMRGGTISGNTASSGGGVYVITGTCTFRIITGTIYGSEPTVEAALQNKATFSGVSGAALYVPNAGTAFYGPTGTEEELSTTNNTIKVADGNLE